MRQGNWRVKNTMASCHDMRRIEARNSIRANLKDFGISAFFHGFGMNAHQDIALLQYLGKEHDLRGMITR